MRTFITKLFVLSFAPTRNHEMDCLMFGNVISERSALKMLSPGYPSDVPPPEPPMKPVPNSPTDVPIPQPFDIPAPDPIDVPARELRDVPPPKSRPEIEPHPKSIPDAAASIPFSFDNYG